MPKKFDYIIIGGGLAGLQLALKMGTDPFFSKFKIAIIEPSTKQVNDKTWCFWEKGSGPWDDILSKTYTKGVFNSTVENIELPLTPYKYKMLRSINFYNYVKSELKLSPNILWIQDKILRLDAKNSVAKGELKDYEATHFFDSRIPDEFLNNTAATKIQQHFKGYVIETTSNVFDEYSFTMMDYRLKYNDSTSFTYILPLSKTSALIEFTLFTPFIIDDKVYDHYLTEYINDILKIKDYQILETEFGVIPMTDYSFEKHNSSNLTKIGTAGGWVKGSTGYSFKHTEKKVKRIIENIKKGSIPNKQLFQRKYKIYDTIFLDVLHQRNDLGEDIFKKFYGKNSPELILKYLDEETTFVEDLKVMLSLFHPQFIKSFFRKIF